MFTNPKKKYFTNKLDSVMRMIWDLEFKVFKTREIREDIRQEFDAIKTRLIALEAQIEGADKKTKPTLLDQKTLMERDRDRFVNQMNGLDLEVNGSSPTADLPDGHQGLNQQIDALYELKEMIKDYAKSL